MRILIADDEILVRIGLKIVLEKCGRNYEIIEAIDGEDAIEKFRRYLPFLVFVDINMPKKDGLAFIEQAKKIDTANFIVLTCHSDFHLMKKAIKIGVKDYIMKTEIDDSELVNIAIEAEREFDKTKSAEVTDDTNANESQIEQELVKAAKGYDFDEAIFNEYVGTRKIQEPLAVMTASVKRIRSVSEKQYAKLAAGLIHVVNGLLGEYGDGHIVELARNEFTLLASFENCDPDGKIEAVAEEFCQRIILATESYFNRVISLGVSICADFKQLPESIKKAREAKKKAFFKRSGGCFFYRGSGKDVSPDGTAELSQKFVTALRAHEYDVCKELIDVYSAKVTEQFPGKTEEVINTLAEIYYLIIHHIEKDYPVYRFKLIDSTVGVDFFSSCDDIYEITEILLGILEKTQKMIQGETEDYHKELVQRAQAYIDSHISDEINLNIVAQCAHLSPTYFSKIFKEIVGSSFIEYTINERIERAKAFINEGDKISVAAARVGYTNYNYFTKLFKSQTGMTPSGYRKAHKLNAAD